MHLQQDCGLNDFRWANVYCYYVDNYTRIPLTLSRIASKSDAFGVMSGLDPAEAEGSYLAVVRVRWSAVFPDKPLPDPSLLQAWTLLKVDGGEWITGERPHTLPSAYPDDAWLAVVNGDWDAKLLDFTPLPETSTADNGMVLGVVDGVWDKFDADNFYLPYPDLITEDTPHTTTVCGDRWLKRPFSTASTQRRGLLPKVPGSSDVVYDGEGNWVDIRGTDFGSWRVGDFRPSGTVEELLWPAADGTTLGISGSGADHEGSTFYDLYIHLGGTADTWERGDLIPLPVKAGMEIFAGGVAYYPSDVSIIVGETTGGPYELEVGLTASFDQVVFSSRSDVDPARWIDRDGTIVCELIGSARESWSRVSVEIESNLSMPTGFFYVRHRTVGGTWRYETVYATEQDVFRPDTLLATGVRPSGATGRPTTAQQSLVIVNGRPIYPAYYKTSVTASGSLLSRGGTRPREPGPSSGVVEECLKFSEVSYYGSGSMVESPPPTENADMRVLLRQLSQLDGYSVAPNLKYRLRKVEGELVGGDWFGAAVGADGKVYFVPHNSRHVLVLDPRNGRMSRIGNYGTRKGKWAGAVVDSEGKIWCMPYTYDSFLIIDTKTGKLETNKCGMSFLSPFFTGGCLTADGRILALSCRSNYELELFPVQKKGTIYDLTTSWRQVMSASALNPVELKAAHPVKELREFVKFDRIDVPFLLGSSTNRTSTLFGGMVIGVDGQPHAVPCGSWMFENAEIGSSSWEADANVPQRPLIYWSMFKKSWRLDNYTPLTSATATSFSMISRFFDWDWRTLAENGWPVEYTDGSPVGINNVRGMLTIARNKYFGGTLGPDGCNYYFPCSGSTPDVLVEGPAISPYTLQKPPASSFRVPDPRFINCRGVALGPDGNMFSACADGTAAFVVSPRTRQVVTLELPHPQLRPRYSAWVGVVTAPDGWMYYVPHDSEYMLIVDPCVPTSPWSSEMNQFINKL